MIEPIRIFSGILIAAWIANSFFVVQAARLYRRSSSRSPILLAFFVIALVIWLAGGFVALLSLRFLLGLPPFPFDGFGLGGVLVGVSFLPGFIHLTMRRLAGREDDRDDERDAARDPGRDSGRDEIRDPARDEARDVERDAVRDEARDAEQAAREDA